MQAVNDQALNEAHDRSEGLIEVESTQQGFHTVGYDGRAGAIESLAGPDAIVYSQGATDFDERLFVDEMGAKARQVALGKPFGKMVEQVGHGQLENGVAEKLEPLVVLPAGAAMSQRARQQLFVLEAVAELALQPPAVIGQRATSTDLSKLTTNETLATNGARLSYWAATL